MSQKSLEDVINAAGNPVELLRNSQTGPYVYPVVPPEYTNWRDEQRAWQETCVLFNQSYHMTDMYIEGPDALKLLSDARHQQLQGLRAQQGEAVRRVQLRWLRDRRRGAVSPRDERLNLVGRPSVHNWVQYHCETGGYNVKLERDERTVAHGRAHRAQGLSLPGAGPECAEGHGESHRQAGARREVLQHDGVQIAGRRVRALRHGMVGQPGFELFGQWEHGEEVKAAIVEAGQEFGLRQSGSRAYSSNTLESGWIPSPMPAIYSGDKMKAVPPVAAGQ